MEMKPYADKCREPYLRDGIAELHKALKKLARREDYAEYVDKEHKEFEEEFVRTFKRSNFQTFEKVEQQ